MAAVAVTLAARAPAVAAAPPPCSIPRVDRVVAVGDVHGAYSRLVEILRVAGLIDGRERWVGGRTHLVQVGDIVDRGPDSRKALDLLRRLEQDAAKAGGAVHVLIGNHEAMRMLTDLRYTVPGEYKAFATPESDDIRRAVIEQQPPKLRDQLLKGTPLGLIEMRVAFGPQGVYGAWLRSQNAVLRIDDVVFVHGGISPAIAALTCDEINDRVRRELTEDIEKTLAAPEHALSTSEDGPLWYRGLAEQPDSFGPEFDQILQQQHARAIVVGHTVVPGARIRVRFGGRFFQIDTGMQSDYVSGGRASALDIQHNTVTAIYTDRHDELATLPAPPTSTP